MRYRIPFSAVALVLFPFTSTTAQAPFWSGLWSGFATHEQSRCYVAFRFTPVGDTAAIVSMTLPAMHATEAAIGRFPVQVEGDDAHIGPFELHYDRDAQTLNGALPSVLVPIYDIPVTLRKVQGLQLPARQDIDARQAQPVWTFDAGAPLWAGAVFANGAVYVGGDDGVLHALDAQTGTERWTFRAGGPIRTRARVAEGSVYLQADDGVVYRIDAANGTVVWQTPLGGRPVERVSPASPTSRYDLFTADVAVDGGRLYVGTHDGRMVALDASNGQQVWEFTAEDAVVAAPAVADGNVYFGSFDHHVYAVNANTGALVWSYDTGAPVTSTPAVADGRVMVGSRTYDLLALRAGDGTLEWKHYVWFSWIESSVALFGGVGYVGSSDATEVLAFDPRSGEARWQADVLGRAFGQPAVTNNRVYVGTSGQASYLSRMRAAVVALDRMAGNPVWQFVPEAQTGTPLYGFTGSLAVGSGLVFATDLGGRVYALRQ